MLETELQASGINEAAAAPREPTTIPTLQASSPPHNPKTVISTGGGALAAAVEKSLLHLSSG
jgi:hypothetical protein